MMMLQHTKQFLNYAGTHSEATVTYHASNMVLAMPSNASYLSKPKAHSRAGGTSSYLATPHFPPKMAQSKIQGKSLN